MIHTPSFAVSTLVSFISEALLQYQTIIFPLSDVEPKRQRCSVGRHLSWCADCKVEVDTMRVELTFLWMSDLLSKWMIQ
jgi:hypothetical protein